MDSEFKETNNTIHLEELRQVWNHYRHLDNMRVKFMNFFFTVLFAVIGLYSAIIKISSDESEIFKSLVGFTLIWFLNILTVYILLNLQKIGSLLKGYTKVIGRFRELLYRGEKKIPSNTSVEEYLTSKPKSIQNLSENLLKFFFLITIILLISILIFNWSIFGWTIKILMIVFIVIVLLFVGLILKK